MSNATALYEALHDDKVRFSVKPELLALLTLDPDLAKAAQSGSMTLDELEQLEAAAAEVAYRLMNRRPGWSQDPESQKKRDEMYRQSKALSQLASRIKSRRHKDIKALARGDRVLAQRYDFSKAVTKLTTEPARILGHMRAGGKGHRAGELGFEVEWESDGKRDYVGRGEIEKILAPASP